MSIDAGGRLTGKVALITGGTSGIGLAIAHRFAAEGARVALVGSSDAAKAKAASEAVSARGATASPFVADLRSPSAITGLVREIQDGLGPIDILVNAAGVWFASPLATMSDAEIEEMLSINLLGPIRMVASVAPGMMARRSGHIVNIASIAALMPPGGYSLYSTSKAGVIAFTKSAALELARHDVSINCISPGNTATPMNESVRQDPAMAGRREWIRRITPSNRQFTPADEIAEVALFLTEGRVRGLHGSVINIDEGRSAGLPAD